MNKSWEHILVEAVSLAIEKLNRISAGRWGINESLSICQGNYESACVYFEVKPENETVIFAIFFNRKDIPDIAKCFIGYSFFVSERMTGAEELLIAELSNIILNSLISSLCNKLNIRLIPGIPKVIQVDKQTGLEIISNGLPSTRQKQVFKNVISLRCNEKDVFCEIYSFLPQDIIETLQGK